MSLPIQLDADSRGCRRGCLNHGSADDHDDNDHDNHDDNHHNDHDHAEAGADDHVARR